TPMEWNQVVEALFYGGAGLLAMSIKGSIEKLTTSVQELNVKVAVVIQQVEEHREKLAPHDERLRELEIK
ncbi:MAG: hypothetical protein ACK5UJ_01855, partial [Pseudobdellovibrionaceae bacterium]